MSTLEHNTEARAAFERMRRDTRSGFRQALLFAGIELPSWAMDRRERGNVRRSDIAVTSDNAGPLPDPTDDELNALFGAA